MQNQREPDRCVHKQVDFQMLGKENSIRSRGTPTALIFVCANSGDIIPGEQYIQTKELFSVTAEEKWGGESILYQSTETGCSTWL